MDSDSALIAELYELAGWCEGPLPQRPPRVPQQRPITTVLREAAEALARAAAPAPIQVPTEQQILDAANEAGLWPNTVDRWIPAFHRYHAALNRMLPAPAPIQPEPVAWRIRDTQPDWGPGPWAYWDDLAALASLHAPDAVSPVVLPAEPPSGLSSYSTLRHLRSDEELELYVQERIAAEPLGAPAPPSGSRGCALEPLRVSTADAAPIPGALPLTEAQSRSQKLAEAGFKPRERMTGAGGLMRDKFKEVTPMTDAEKAQRKDELAKRIAHANALGVRAEVCGDAEQRAEAARIYAEAMEELRMLDAPAAASTAIPGADTDARPHVTMRIEGPCAAVEQAMHALGVQLRGWLIVRESVQGDIGRSEVVAVRVNETRRFNAYPELQSRGQGDLKDGEASS